MCTSDINRMIYLNMIISKICSLVYTICMYIFFFFKQKTAYEMRISDWSSDVCSSDLFTKQRPCAQKANASHHAAYHLGRINREMRIGRTIAEFEYSEDRKSVV